MVQIGYKLLNFIFTRLKMNKLLANKKSNLSLDSKDVDGLAERAKKLSNTNLGLLLGESFKLKVNIVTIIHRKLIQLVQSNNQCSQLFRQYRCRKHRVLSLSSRFKERPIISKERSMLHVWQRVFCPVVDTCNARQGSCI